MDGLALYGDSDHEESGDGSILTKSASKPNSSDSSKAVDELTQRNDVQPAVGSTINDNCLETTTNSRSSKLTLEPNATPSYPDSTCDSSSKWDLVKSGEGTSSTQEPKQSSETSGASSSKSEKVSSSTEDSTSKKHSSERRPSARDTAGKKHSSKHGDDRKDGSGRSERRRTRSRERGGSVSGSSKGHGGKSGSQRHRSKSKDRHQLPRSRSKDRKRSRSRSHPRSAHQTRSRSRDRHLSKSKERTAKRRSHSQDRHAKKRAHSRSRSKERHSSRKVSPPTATKVEDKQKASSPDPNTTVITVRFPTGVSHIVVDKQQLDGAGEVPSNLPLQDAATCPRIGTIVTPQMAVQQAMAAMNAKAQIATGVALPKYYNPSAVNPMKYAEQIQKRKLLWQSNKVKKEDPASSSNQWESTMFPQDQDGKMAAKFKKLMGIKNKESAAGTSALPPQSEEQIKKQEELFRTLDQQYEVARISTHTHRGVGLGFSSALQPQYLIPK